MFLKQIEVISVGFRNCVHFLLSVLEMWC